jgi:hypothetical protein
MAFALSAGFGLAHRHGSDAGRRYRGFAVVVDHGVQPQAGRQRMERWRSCCPRRCLQEAWFVSGREVPVRHGRDFRLGAGEAGAVHCHVGGCTKLVPDLSWLALLVGLIVVMKTYWVALLVRSSVQKPIDI